MIINTSGQSIGAQMIDALTGAAFTGGVNVYVTIDAGTQGVGSVNSGLCTAEGNGYYTYRPTAAETNGSLLAFTFIGSGAIPATIQVATVTAGQQTALGSATGSGSILVSDLITQACRRINVIQEGESPTAAMMDDAFARFNDLIDSVCGNDELLIYTISRTTWTISSTKGTLASPYTVGSGGDININRPTFLPDGAVRYQDTSVTPTLEYPLTPLTDDAWRLLPQKNLTSPLPTSYYYNPTFAAGLGSLYLWLVPTQTTLQGVMYYPAQVTRFNSISDTIALPPGYNRFLRDNLAVELASEFRENVPVDPTLMASAAQSKAIVKRKNHRLSDLSIDTALLPTRRSLYNINSDTWGR
jgi:hypothetical protein